MGRVDGLIGFSSIWEFTPWTPREPVTAQETRKKDRKLTQRRKDAVENRVNPHSHIRLLPNVSAIAPAGIIKALTANIYPIAIHCAEGISAPKCSEIIGITIAVADCSTTVINVPSATAQYVHHRKRGLFLITARGIFNCRETSCRNQC